MRIIVLSGEHGGGWHVRDLQRAGRALGYEVTGLSWTGLIGSVGLGPEQSRRLIGLEPRPDVLLLRTMPPGSLEQIVFRMDLMQRWSLAGLRVVNPPRAIEAAVDKFLASARLEAAGLPVLPTVVCQNGRQAMQAFEQLGRDVVIKPLFGSEGFGITRLSDPALAERAFTLMTRLGQVVHLQRAIDPALDARLLVLGGRVIAAMRRSTDRWPSNLARGGQGLPMPEPPTDLKNLAVRAVAAIGADVAGVDVLVDQADHPWVLEVNAVPGWRALWRISGVDVGESLLRWLKETAPG